MIKRQTTEAVLTGDGKTATVTLGTGQRFETRDSGPFVNRLDRQMHSAGFGRETGYSIEHRNGERVLVATAFHYIESE